MTEENDTPPPDASAPRKPRGTAAMDQETRIRVARAGGLASSKDRVHMAVIGKKGGATVSQDREHMSRIGKMGKNKGKKSP